MENPFVYEYVLFIRYAFPNGMCIACPMPSLDKDHMFLLSFAPTIEHLNIFLPTRLSASIKGESFAPNMEHLRIQTNASFSTDQTGDPSYHQEYTFYHCVRKSKVLQIIVVGGQVFDIAGGPQKKIYIYIHRVYKWYTRYVYSIYGGPPAKAKAKNDAPQQLCFKGNLQIKHRTSFWKPACL